jgi:hypothetical protein
LLALLLGLVLVIALLQVPATLRYRRDPARQSAIREPITFQSRVSLRFTYVPWRWPTPLVGRWDLAVRTDTFRVTHWIWGQRDRARSTFFRASECVMWRNGEGDGVVVSGPTYLRSKVEFVFSTAGRDQQAWAALLASGVRPVTSPSEAVTDMAAAATGRRAFARVGADLGDTPKDLAGLARQMGRKAPVKARRSRLWIIAAIVFVLVIPRLLILLFSWLGLLGHLGVPLSH